MIRFRDFKLSGAPPLLSLSFGGKKLISNGGGDEGHGDLEISGQDNGR